MVYILVARAVAANAQVLLARLADLRLCDGRAKYDCGRLLSLLDHAAGTSFHTQKVLAIRFVLALALGVFVDSSSSFAIGMVCLGLAMLKQGVSWYRAQVKIQQQAYEEYLYETARQRDAQLERQVEQMAYLTRVKRKPQSNRVMLAIVLCLALYQFQYLFSGQAQSDMIHSVQVHTPRVMQAKQEKHMS